MRHLRAVLVLAALALGPAVKAQEGDIRGVIADQVAAFGANDLSTAFSFASPDIQRLFGNPARFGAMVERGYPMVWRPAEMQFGALQEGGGQVVQIVYFTDPAGRVFEAAYEMVETDGAWRINGVYIREHGAQS